MKDEVLALTKLRRTRNNLETIKEMIGELRERADSADEGFSALSSAREALSELSGALETDDNPFMSWAAAVRDRAETFLAELPGEEIEEIGDLITEAEGYAEEYEDSLEDREVSADDREEVWGNLLNALEDIAGVMD